MHFPLHKEKQNMKRRFMTSTLTILGLLVFVTAAAFAQGRMDRAERDVRIVEGPNITDVTEHSAKIEWITNADGANHVVYRVEGSNQEWQSAYHQGGGTRHFLRLDNLEPGRTYEWKILTQDGDVRKQGEFRTDGHWHSDDRGGGYRDCGGGHDRWAGDRVALYRAVNTANGGHLYSTNADEQNRREFQQEGAAGYILGVQRDGTLPLYRLSNGNGDYLLTTDTREIRRMQKKFGYRNDGVIGYIANTQRPGTQPFYRLVRADGGGHFFTASNEEREKVLRTGWRDEGVAGYIWGR
jgi:hypothetical protein